MHRWSSRIAGASRALVTPALLCAALLACKGAGDSEEATAAEGESSEGVEIDDDKINGAVDRITVEHIKKEIEEDETLKLSRDSSGETGWSGTLIRTLGPNTLIVKLTLETQKEPDADSARRKLLALEKGAGDAPHFGYVGGKNVLFAECVGKKEGSADVGKCDDPHFDKKSMQAIVEMMY